MSNPKPRDALRWHAVVDRCFAEAGHLGAGLAATWRADIDAVEAMARRLEATAPRAAHVDNPGEARSRSADGRAGLHALVALAAASTVAWPDGASSRHAAAHRQLLAVACAVELAHRAVEHHDDISDSVGETWRSEPSATRASNRRHVLDGDWSITEAAVLVADISPAAYRILVRGYGAVQMASIEGRRDKGRAELLFAAASLGALIAGVPDGDCELLLAALARPNDPAVEVATLGSPGERPKAMRVCRWAALTMEAPDARARRAPQPERLETAARPAK